MLSNGSYPALHRAGVELVTDAITAMFGTALAEPVPHSGPWSRPDLVAHGLDERHVRFVELLTPALRRSGALRPEPDGRFRLVATPVRYPEVTARASTEASAFVHGQTLLAHQTHQLPGILRGRRDPWTRTRSTRTSAWTATAWTH
ncbi:hypothetical protein [Streptomyces fumanus]|uniref:Uncharacterized protein n=1 Tax=Streptomyces fumanus TaxID=67302 RepID=A0A919ABA8_9ACTN|nr:hypothetical protein [Streptomyces fumanus]GHE93227.1 hypothetical protein GCM10018772_16250 [Streptomyces fumanus]